jgi:hypothetical protein
MRRAGCGLELQMACAFMIIDEFLISSFDMNDGLCYNQFNEQAAYRMSNGQFCLSLPTKDLYCLTLPESKQRKQVDLPVFITNFKVLGKDKSCQR